jgi:hypothetical protein
LKRPFTPVNVVVVLALMGIAWFPACRGASESDTSSDDRYVTGNGTSAFVQDYLQVADAAGAETTVVDAEFLADALRKLAAALGTLNLAAPELQVELRVAAEHVLLSPRSIETTAAVRDSLISAADAIQAGGTAGAGVRQSAESLRADQPLLDQDAAIREFLGLSGPPLRRAAESVDRRGQARHGPASCSTYPV